MQQVLIPQKVDCSVDDVTLDDRGHPRAVILFWGQSHRGLEVTFNLTLQPKTGWTFNDLPAKMTNIMLTVALCNELPEIKAEEVPEIRKMLGWK